MKNTSSLSACDSGLSSSTSSIEELVSTKTGTTELTNFLIKQANLKKQSSEIQLSCTDYELATKKFFNFLLSNTLPQERKNLYKDYEYLLFKFLTSVPLTGETHVRISVLELFSENAIYFLPSDEHYNQSDHNLLTNRDSNFQLTVAIVILNSDLHILEHSRKMTKEQFVKNINSNFKKETFSPEFLSLVYRSKFEIQKIMIIFIFTFLLNFSMHRSKKIPYQHRKRKI